MPFLRVPGMERPSLKALMISSLFLSTIVSSLVCMTTGNEETLTAELQQMRVTTEIPKACDHSSPDDCKSPASVSVPSNAIMTTSLAAPRKLLRNWFLTSTLGRGILGDDSCSQPTGGCGSDDDCVESHCECDGVECVPPAK